MQALVVCDPTRDLRHRDTRAAPDCADWLAFKTNEGLAPRSLDAYEKAVAMLLRAFPETAVDEFTEFDVAHVLASVPTGSYASIRVRINSFFEFCEAHDRIQRNPMNRIPKRRNKRQVVYDIYSDAEIALLTRLPLPDGPLMRVLVDTGLRKGEARRLRWRHVQLSDMLLVVYEGKGRKDRIVPLTQECFQALDDLAILEGLDPDDYLWYGLAGGRQKHITRHKPVGEARFHNWYAACVETSGVRYRRPHICRHTFATIMLRAGTPLELVADYLGHDSVDTTRDTYRHLNVEDMRLGVRLLDQSRKVGV